MIAFVHTFVFPAAFALLPPTMDTPEARAMLLAIGLQESEFTDRYQVLDGGGRGPARGFWQFELGGATTGVLAHAGVRTHALRAIEALREEPAPARVYAALEHNDVLACVFARLLLYTLPAHLPKRHATNKAWAQYIEAWRPGKPHPDKWDGNFARAWALVAGEPS